MASSYVQRESNEVFLGLVKGLSIHILIVVIIIISSFIVGLFVDGKAEDAQKDKIKIIKQAVRVDVVGMPKLTLQELKKMTMDDFQIEPVEEIKEIPKDEGGNDKVQFKKVAKKINTMSLLSRLSSKSVSTKAKKIKRSKFKFNRSRLKKLMLDGNKVNKGTAIIGDTSDSTDALAFEQYASNLPNVIRPHWKLPSYLIDQNLQCRIQVFIATDGRLIKAKIYESSGSNEYDQRALDSVKKSAPFPSPEGGFAKNLRVGELILGFPL
jgi:colicin import membrane protein